MKFIQSICKIVSLALFVYTTSATAYEPKEIRIAFNTALTPQSQERMEESIDVDIVRNALQHQGFKLVPVYVPVKQLENAYKEKSVDGVVIVDHTPPGAQVSKPYITYENVAITLKSNPHTIRTVNDLKGLKISAFKAAAHYLGAPFQTLTENNPLYSEEAQQLTQLDKLYSDEVDVIIIDRTIFDYLNTLRHGGANENHALPVVIHTVFEMNPQRIAFHDKALRDQFNDGVGTLTKSDIDAIFGRDQNVMRFAP